MRPYGFDACEIDAFGKAEVFIMLDQASRGDIGNLLRCSCALVKIAISGAHGNRSPAATRQMTLLIKGPLETKYNLK
ncbi:hypothetical protein RLEG12_07080 (plasmid) [Rhizobium leguminosarum bv. trifolii CB782]|nr:hypothetical protein RLEG12_07080 [Rhizobium leguminosarum bv. trifolii CB782]